eukprot:2688745-Rhodomonas_salina.1
MAISIFPLQDSADATFSQATKFPKTTATTTTKPTRSCILLRLHQKRSLHLDSGSRKLKKKNESVASGLQQENEAIEFKQTRATLGLLLRLPRRCAPSVSSKSWTRSRTSGKLHTSVRSVGRRYSVLREDSQRLFQCHGP